MANNILEQLEEMYSRWSVLDKVGKEMQLEGKWQRAQVLYQALQWPYNSKGGLTTEEWNRVSQLQQLILVLRVKDAG